MALSKIEEASRLSERVAIDKFVEAALNEDGMYDPKQRFINISQIPIICMDIKNIKENMTDIKNNMISNVLEMKKSVEEIIEMMREDRDRSDTIHEKFVRKDGEYFLIRSIVFGGVGLAIVAIAGALISSVLK